MSARAFLGIGSNLGERLSNLQRAADLLDATQDLTVVASSRIWETDPVGGPEQPDFLNAVLEIATTLSAREVLAVIGRVEASLGRERDVRWGPRTIDIDILVYDELAIDEPDLTVPHPRLRERAFAVLPLLELAPDLSLPDGTALRSATVSGEARLFAPPLRVSGGA